MPKALNEELKRIAAFATKDIPLALWGPYVSERQWGAVREDYSADGNAWDYFPYEHARSRCYIWGEDGIAAISDIYQNICFGLALWNGNDPYLKERLYGLSNPQGNHGEDVKELYYHLENLPTHSYMRYLYKYPIQAFPYETIKQINQNKSKNEPEFEILDTGIFENDQYFDVYTEYAKYDDEDIIICFTVENRSKDTAEIMLLPTIWFYNKWQYGALSERPVLTLEDQIIKAKHPRAGKYYLYFTGADEILFTENETNLIKLFNRPNKSPFVKDGIHEYIVNGNKEAVNPENTGTKASIIFNLSLKANESKKIYLRLSKVLIENPFSPSPQKIIVQRKKECNQYYQNLLLPCKPDLFSIKQNALWGILWSRQFYYYDVEWWLQKTDGISPYYESRQNGRNATWKYLKNQDIISIPDKWEYPWYASWDSAFHMITLAMVDPQYAKHQMILLLREWYMNQEGQLPAYEWDFSDVNPPVHAFAALEIYRHEKKSYGQGDLIFLKTVFQKLIINFTWWVNRKDANGNSIFEGGFLGLDNIGLFNRNTKLCDNIVLEQSDATSWMSMYALNMMEIAVEIALSDISFEDSVTKFYEHFVIIAEALNQLDLWNEEDQFFYDVLVINHKDIYPLKVRSVVGLIPLFSVAVFENKALEKLPDFIRRMNWYENYRKRNNKYLPNEETSDQKKLLLSTLNKERLIALLERMNDQDEFLSDYGIRSLSKIYNDNPYSLNISNNHFSIQYESGESITSMFGGNSNWRGPIWIPMNYLIIKSIYKYADFYADDFRIEFPSKSGIQCTLLELGFQLTERLVSIYLPDLDNKKPVYGDYNSFYEKEGNELILFHEYFDGDTGKGLGASHQTGWTSLLCNLIEEYQFRGGKKLI